MSHVLVLLRHAKSAYPPGVDDHERPLNPRGRRDAPVAGRLIAGFCPIPQRVLVSTATRAQQTWQLAAPALLPASVSDDPHLYLAAPEEMLDRIRGVDASSLIVVSHNPGTELLALGLAADLDSAAGEQMCTKFPTAAFAVLSSEAPFRDWDYGRVQLDAFEVARG